MPTDDERLAVARRLRQLHPEDRCWFGLHGFDWGLFAGELLDAIGYDKSGCDEWTDHLADLIEPNRGSGGRTILCAHCESASWCGCEPGDEQGGCDFEPSVTEGEPPYNLYSPYEAVLKRHPRDECAIDDDEVDELVDALLDICNAPGHDVIQRPQPSCDRDALLALADEMMRHVAMDERNRCRRWVSPEEAVAYARRIREALGVES